MNEIMNHKGVKLETEPAVENTSAEQIGDHIEKYIGPIDFVMHEEVSDKIHVDIYLVGATEDRPYQTLITSGMSSLKIAVPEEFQAELSPYMELMIHLPKDWPISPESLQKGEWFWPIQELKYLARSVHKYNTWYAPGHTIPHGDPPEPFSSDTKLSGALIWYSSLVSEEGSQLKIDNDKTIYFYSVFPLYEEEMNLKLEKGLDVLLSRLSKLNNVEIVDKNRKNVGKKTLGLF